MAAERGATSAQLALAWVLAKDPRCVPIPGTRRIQRLEENAKSTDIKLSRADLDRLDRIAPHGVAAGTRYPEAGLRTVHR